MSTPWIFYRLYSLDPSSLDFSCRLHSLIQHDEEEQYLSSLQGSQLARLLDFLDQTLSNISTDDDLSRQCLHKLQAICGHRATLPSSYVISVEIARVSDHPIALGGISDVWEGTYHRKKVSIKRLTAPVTDNESLKKLFFKEAVIWKRLRHPNIVPFIGVTTNPLQIVSERMPNRTLIEFIKRNPDTNRTSLLLDIAKGLNYLHANHTIHRNLNGHNILVGRCGHARLTDFDFLTSRETNSITQKNRYTAAWAAPEILEGIETITRETDVFAFGMVMIEVFTGERPFSEFTTPVITSKIVGGERPARPQPEAQGRGLTDSIWDVTVRCWHQDPPQRPTMTEVVRLLREYYRTMAAWRAGITDIPVKLFIDNILPFCEAKDILSLGCASKFFALFATDVFWR